MHALDAAKRIHPSTAGAVPSPGATANLQELNTSSTCPPRAPGFVVTAPRIPRSSTRTIQLEGGAARPGGAGGPGVDCVGPPHLVNAWRQGSAARAGPSEGVPNAGGKVSGASMAGAFLSKLQAALPPSEYEDVRKAISAYTKVALCLFLVVVQTL